MPVADKIVNDIEIPDGVKVAVSEHTLSVSGPLGDDSRLFYHPNLDLSTAGSNVTVKSVLPRKQDKALAGTWSGHIRNMLHGVSKGFTCKLKMVHSHFPIKTSSRGKVFVIENFLGERHPRRAPILEGVEVVVDGDFVEVHGNNKERVGQTAANIEQATRIRKRDPRVFQDGIYIIEKAR